MMETLTGPSLCRRRVNEYHYALAGDYYLPSATTSIAQPVGAGLLHPHLQAMRGISVCATARQQLEISSTYR